MKIINTLFLLFILSGCATVESKQDKIDTIAQEEVKKEYKLPFLTECPALEKFNGLGFDELYTYNKLLREQYKICNTYNQDKLDWLKRNFPEEVKK